jgi:GrpB-like predicted nucleotidyltransferase (UPF0157 family)
LSRRLAGKTRRSKSGFGRIRSRTPKILNGPILLSAYNPEWPMSYARLEGRIRNALGSRALLAEHVGSTSVPGLSAKPIIDTVLLVSDSNGESSYVPPIGCDGFKLTVRESHWLAHRMFKSPTPEGIFTYSRLDAKRYGA